VRRSGVQLPFWAPPSRLAYSAVFGDKEDQWNPEQGGLYDAYGDAPEKVSTR